MVEDGLDFNTLRVEDSHCMTAAGSGSVVLIPTNMMHIAAVAATVLTLVIQAASQRIESSFLGL